MLLLRATAGVPGHITVEVTTAAIYLVVLSKQAARQGSTGVECTYTNVPTCNLALERPQQYVYFRAAMPKVRKMYVHCPTLLPG